jgi:hypothetical protein
MSKYPDITIISQVQAIKIFHEPQNWYIGSKYVEWFKEYKYIYLMNHHMRKQNREFREIAEVCLIINLRGEDRMVLTNKLIRNIQNDVPFQFR